MKNLKVRVEYEGMTISIKLNGFTQKITLLDDTNPLLLNFLYDNGYSDVFINMGEIVEELPLIVTKKTKPCNCKKKK